MTLYQESTKYKPLLFFQTFLTKESLDKYESSFYDCPINPSQVSSMIGGYIEYSLSEYKEGDNPLQKVYFKDQLRKLLNNNVILTCKLLEEREGEILYHNDKPDIFINRQLSLLEKIKKQANNYSTYSLLVLKHINTIEVYLNQLLNSKHTPIRMHVGQSPNYDSYFKTNVKTHVVAKLYESAIVLNIIDADIVTKEQFMNVFTLPILPNSEVYITFSSNNRRAIFFLDTVKPLFNNLSPSKIDASRSFFVKPKRNGKRKYLNANEIYKVRSYLKKNQGYKDITDALQHIISKEK